MADLSNYLENAWANTLRGGGAGTSFTAPAALYVKLHTGDPGEDATLNASAETDRMEIQFGASADGVITSTTAQEWAAWDAGAETISHVSVWDASTAGNPVAKGALTASKAVANSDTFRLPIGDVTLTIA
jgi:hypothetical protein